MTAYDTLLLASGSTEKRQHMREIFRDSFNLLEADNEAQALMLLEQNHGCIAAMLLEISVPEKLDMAALKEIRRRHMLGKVPVIVLTPPDEPDLVGEAFAQGAIEAMGSDYDPFVLQKRVENIVELHRHKWNLEKMVEEKEEILRHSNDAMVDVLSSIIEYRSVESGQHILRIRRFTRILLEEIARSSPRYHLDEKTIGIISSAAALHDIGKISIPDAILNKPGPLTEEEREIMKSHSRTGSRILQLLADVADQEYLRYAYNICRFHHERWDGNGYPEGRAGDNIPICAQVVGLADAYDALTTRRVYKDAVDCDLAANMIMSGECGVFSPPLLECFKHVAGKFAEVARDYADGASPRAERFDTQLPPPSQSDELNALQIMRYKYQMLLHYLDAAVMEVDLDQFSYHVVYNPDPNLNLISTTNSLWDLIDMVSGMIRDQEERENFREFVMTEVPRFWDEGLMRMQYPLRIYDRFLKESRNYRLILLRQSVANRKLNKLIVLCEPQDDSADEYDRYHDSEWIKSIPASLTPVHCNYRNDRELTVVSIDDRALRSMGYTRETFMQKTQGKLMRLIHPDDRKSVRSQTAAQLAMGKRLELECRLICNDGSSMWILNRCRLEVDERGEELFRGFVLDISQTKQGLEALQRRLDQQQIILSQTENVLFEWDLIEDRLTFSDSWEEIFGYPPTEGMLRERLDGSSHFHPEDVAVVKEGIAAMYDGDDYKVIEVRLAKADGRYLWCRFRATAQRDQSGRPAKIVGIIINVDEEKRSAQALQEQAERDTLTKLLNKSAARTQVEACLKDSARNPRCALFVIDLDDFKGINDRMGHLFGDAVLTQVAREIRGLFRSQDVVARIGGDEFMVLMRGAADRRIVEARCARLVESIQHVLRSHLQGNRLSCSVGVSLYPEHGRFYAELFQKADRALYRSKDKGKNCFVIYDDNDSGYFSQRVSAAAVTRIDSDDQTSIAGGSILPYVFRLLYTSTDIEKTVGDILALAGQQTDVSRVYIFENSRDGQYCSNTFEWCNEGILPQREYLQNVSYQTDVPGLIDRFDERGIFYCTDISQLPRDLHGIMSRQNIKSILLCAFRDNGVFRGYMGFDECQITRYWTREQVDALTYLAEMVGVFLIKKQAEERGLPA